MQSQFSNSTQSFVSFDSLIKAQQEGSKQNHLASETGHDFAQMVEEETKANKNKANARTAGRMPQFGENFEGSFRSQYAPAAPEKQSSDISDYIGRNNKGSRTYSEGELARKYVRETDPRYADVTVGDFVDIINPLQHLPIVSSIYRHVTGDEIKPPARIMGGGIYGGPIGMASAMANAVVEDQTGKDIGDNFVASIAGAGDEKASVRNSFADIEPASGTNGVGFEEAKKAYSSDQAYARDLDIAWTNSKASKSYEPIDISDTVEAESKFFKNSENALSYRDVLEGKNESIEDIPAQALAFGPGAYGASAIHDATKAYGGGRTAGAMPEFSAKTLSLKPKDELAEQLRMDNPPAREPVTRVQFGD
jgi:hypothetical protein